ncbi:hypothetical protein MVEG_01810 [Podila verticillata NRRL 6337]|nr:hypothetical protein MVEG_01810 [Podila verticillata NRRL 6337]
MSRRSTRIASTVIPAATSVVSSKTKSTAASTSSPASKRRAVEKDSEAPKATPVKMVKKAKAEPTPEPEDDGLTRCIWANSSRYPLLQKYHDEEWCVPGGFDRSNRYLFELLILEGAQAGLSWSTVLHKREAYRAAYDNFDYKHIAKTYTSPASNERLLQTNIVKNKLKVEASIVNARLFVELLDEFCPEHTALDDKEGFWHFLEQYKKTPARVLESRATPGYKTSSEESDRLSADLKKRGFKFVGTTIIHAYLVALGIEVEDARHSEPCFKYSAIPKK